MARRDFGTIIEIERGAKYGLRWTQNDERGRRKRYETFHGNKTGAKARLREIEADVRSKGRDRSVPTFGEAYERWYLPALAQRVANGTIKQRTVDQYERIYRYTIRERWEDVPVSCPGQFRFHTNAKRPPPEGEGPQSRKAWIKQVGFATRSRLNPVGFATNQTKGCV